MHGKSAVQTVSERVAQVARMKRLSSVLLFVVGIAAFCQTPAPASAEETRYYKAEHGVAASYLELSTDGTYRVMTREHFGVDELERGKWRQEASVITFSPSSWLRGGQTVSVEGKSYKGTEEEYKGKTFLVFNTEDSAGIAIPVEETKRQLDAESRALPNHVFFKTTADVFAKETGQTYPFRYVEPAVKKQK